MTDLALLATKVTVHSLGQMVVQECHLSLNLADMRETDKYSFLDSPISQAGLFSDAVKNFAQQLELNKVPKLSINSSFPRGHGWQRATLCLSALIPSLP